MARYRYRPPCTEETKAKISAGIKRARAEGRWRRWWQPPAQYQELYDALMRKGFGVAATRRLIEEHRQRSR